MKTEKVLLYVGIAIVAYIFYQKLKSTATAIVNAPAAIGVAASNTLYDFLNPNAAGAATTHIVVFPDGSSHAVDPSTVASDGSFTWTDGQKYILFAGVGGYAAVLASSIVSAPTDTGSQLNAATDTSIALGRMRGMGRY